MNPFVFYKDVCAAQLPETLDFFNLIISQNNFKRIIEIGTNRGGLTSWLNDNRPAECSLISYDITSQYLEIDIKNIDFRIGDCFGAKKQEIKDLIIQDGQTLLLCDGGNKNAEFVEFSPSLKKNDIIMLHDYNGENSLFEEVRVKNGWPSPHESSFEFIKESVKSNNLKNYMSEQSEKCLWGSFKKA